MRLMSRTLTAALLLVLGCTVAAAQQVPAAVTAAPPTRQITVDEAVRLALENNLGIQTARFDPQISDLSVAAARAAWVPALTTTVQQANTDAPSTSFLSGGQSKISNGRFASNIGVQQSTPWGGLYSLGWDTTRSTTTNLFSNFSPQLQSSLALHVEQPLIRNFGIDSLRQQLRVTQTNRGITDVQLQQQIASTTRTVRQAYWELAYAIASLQVQQQSLELAQESLRNTQARVNIGTTPPIDIVEAQAEVATRQEAVIVGQSQIDSAEDTLRTLIYNPAVPDFWSLQIVPTDLPTFAPLTVDVDGAVRNALDQRTDLQQSRRTLQVSDINLQYFRNQTLPNVTAVVDYSLTGLGGTQFLRGNGFPGPIVGQTDRGFGSVIGDLFRNQYPSWTLGLNVNYPVGRSVQEASLARARLQYSQSQTQIRNQELQVVTQVRSAARSVATNQQRIQTTRVSRELAERRLDAEQRKLAAGTSTNFIVFQAQRDLAQARNNELRAILDYNRSVIDLDTVQVAPLTGGVGAISTTTTTTTGTGGTTGTTTTTTAGTSTGAATTSTSTTATSTTP